ncbi:unnamed protein product [Didymodactylos carnosus]|uniref:B box-type domain-containing protein n=1 Tax=Didymodactylos carnosus TaxID=1234261 RepID=A0A8S2J6K6_9BILA|nr:unnamed protein product [Didymodactylos carnosus]CAF3797164.1 unnamed protein product [Didymodactylos carnosus]
MSTASRVQCIKCTKNASITTCHGCLAELCRRCFNDHRQDLSKELDHVVYEHDMVKQQFETPNKNDSHRLLKQIDELEKDSTDKINQLAERCRIDVVKLLDKNKDQLIDRFRKISNSIRKGRDDEDYVERDLSKWMAGLKELKDELIKPSNFRVEEDKQQSPWIQKIRVSEDFHDQAKVKDEIGGYDDRQYSSVPYPSQTEISQSCLSFLTPLYQDVCGVTCSYALPSGNKRGDRRTTTEYRQNSTSRAYKRDIDMKEQQQQEQYPTDRSNEHRQRRLSGDSDRMPQESSDSDIYLHKRPYAPTTISDIDLNDVVKFSRPGGKISQGVVKYIGTLPGKFDLYLGLELEDEAIIEAG